MGRKLLSFKYANGQVAVSYRNEKGGDANDKMKLETKDIPRIELQNALQAMGQHLIEICELPAHWADQVTVRGVTNTWKQGERGIVIRGVRELKHSNTPLAINSPHVREEADGIDDDEGFEDIDSEAVEAATGYSAECAKAMDHLSELIFRFVDGERQQGELFVGDQAQPQPELSMAGA